MTYDLFANVSEIYKKTNSVSITRHKVAHTTLKQYCIGLNTFQRNLGELSDDDYWYKFLSPLKRLRFGLCAATFTQSYVRQRVDEILASHRKHLLLSKRLYPDYAQLAEQIVDSLEVFGHDSKDPLFEQLIDLTSVDERTAWVVKESRLIPHVEEKTRDWKFPNLDIVHPLQLKSITTYDRLVVIGPSSWFPNSVFTASRADQIHIVLFNWIYDSWKPSPVFQNPHKSSGRSARKQMLIQDSIADTIADGISPDSILMDVGQSIFANLRRNQTAGDEYDLVQAVCVLLEGDSAIFIDNSEGSKIHILDLDEDVSERISRISVDEIAPGDFVLVRTSGGGDYIVPIADQIMGSVAQEARKCQLHWKQLLRDYVLAKGLFETALDLIDLGSLIANEMNVRNWMSPRSIRTQDPKDFLAIMKLTGLEEDADRYWQLMNTINSAHRKAGFKIREILLEQVQELDVDELQKSGRLDFKISDDDEGGLTAFRVEKVLNQSIEVPYHRIGHPFKLEDQ